MTRETIAATAVPVGGYNVTDSEDFETLSTGAGNGVSFPQSNDYRIILKNDSGGAATFTIKIPTPANLTELSLTVPDFTVAVANGKTYELKALSQFRQSDGNVYIDCSAAGKVLVLS